MAVRPAMPRIYTATFVVHDYTLNAFGELRASTYARLLQQAATEASADAGYPDSWYVGAGTFWLVRRTSIDFLEPLRGSDVVQVRTWVTDFRRVRSQREYEVCSVDRGIPVARAHTDWVYVERVTGRPRRIPSEIMESLMPGGVRPSFPRLPWSEGGAPPGAFRASRTVEFRDIDALAHVNNANYIDYVEDAAIAAATAVGWPLDRVVGLGGCWRPQLHDVEYLAEAFHGDRLSCTTWVTAIDGAEIERQSEIRRVGQIGQIGPVGRVGDDALLVRARSRWTWIGRETGEPAGIPTALAAALRD